jgi:hypothetical protein
MGSRQFVEQRPDILQVWGIDALGELAVDGAIVAAPGVLPVI